MSQTDQINTGKKRTHDQHLTLMQISALQFGDAFRSKADFHGYWSQRLKVRPSDLLTFDLDLCSGTARPSTP